MDVPPMTKLPPKPKPCCNKGSNPPEHRIDQPNSTDCLTLRDQFAISALQGLCAADAYSQAAGANLAKKAYFLADAMLEERKNIPSTK